MRRMRKNQKHVVVQLSPPTCEENYVYVLCEPGSNVSDDDHDMLAHAILCLMRDRDEVVVRRTDCPLSRIDRGL